MKNLTAQLKMEKSDEIMSGAESSEKNPIENNRSGEKYGLRPRTSIKRLQLDLPLPEVSRRSRKLKPRSASLSKYRRKTANARERHRMKAINTAFESLRRVLPDALEVQSHSSSMTKINTLRLAVDYIQALSNVLDDDEGVSSNPLNPSEYILSQHDLASSLAYSNTMSSVTAVNSQSDMNKLQSKTDLTHAASSDYLSFQYKEEMLPLCSRHPLVSFCSTSSHMSTSCSTPTSRGSLGSSSDLDDLLSDDSGLLEDNLDVFHDIPTTTLSDPLEVLLQVEKDVLPFTSELLQ